MFLFSEYFGPQADSNCNILYSYFILPYAFIFNIHQQFVDSCPKTKRSSWEWCKRPWMNEQFVRLLCECAGFRKLFE